MSKFYELEDTSFVSASDSWFKRIAIRIIERLTGQKELQRLYDILHSRNRDKIDVWPEILKILNITMEFTGFPLDKVPNDRPLVLISNHPLGIIDGVGAGLVMSRLKKEYRIILNRSLRSLDKLSVGPCVLPIDFKTTREALTLNIQTRKNALDVLKNNGGIIIFPSGEIATAHNPLPGSKVYEAEWKGFVGKMARVPNTLMLPLFFEGKNGWLFQLLSIININIRVVLLGRETLKKQGKTFKVHVGEPFDLDASIEPKATTQYLRSKVEELRPTAHTAAITY